MARVSSVEEARDAHFDRGCRLKGDSADKLGGIGVGNIVRQQSQDFALAFLPEALLEVGNFDGKADRSRHQKRISPSESDALPQITFQELGSYALACPRARIQRSWQALPRIGRWADNLAFLVPCSHLRDCV